MEGSGSWNGSWERRRSGGRRALLVLVAALLTGCADEPPEHGEVEIERDRAVESSAPIGDPAVLRPAGPDTGAPSPQAGAREVDVRLVEWEIDLGRDTVDAGPTTFRVRNAGTRHHAFEVEGQGIEEETEHLQPGQTANLTVDLKPGQYTVYCPVKDDVDHRAQGMVTTLHVREGGGGTT